VDPPLDPGQISAAAKRLKRRIDAFHSWRQSVYATAFQLELDAAQEVVEGSEHSVKLQLPSTVDDPAVLQPQCASVLERLRRIEFGLRHGFIESMISKLRDFIATRAVHESQDPAPDGQHSTTRSKAALNEAQRRVSTFHCPEHTDSDTV